MEDCDSIIDQFVARLNSTSLERLHGDDIPVFLREGDEDQHRQYGWKIKRMNYLDRIARFEDALSKKLPPSYRSLVSRYAFPAFEVGPLMLYANTGENLLWELTTRAFADPVMSAFLLQNGFLQFGNPYFYNYDPVCFDTSRSLDEECPIVQIDHEAILCDSTIRVVKEISPSFLTFAERFSRPGQE